MLSDHYYHKHKYTLYDPLEKGIFRWERKHPAVQAITEKKGRIDFIGATKNKPDKHYIAIVVDDDTTGISFNEIVSKFDYVKIIFCNFSPGYLQSKTLGLI